MFNPVAFIVAAKRTAGMPLNLELFDSGPAVKLTHGGFNAGSPTISSIKASVCS
jgi:hypothetical protein